VHDSCRGARHVTTTSSEVWANRRAILAASNSAPLQAQVLVLVPALALTLVPASGLVLVLVPGPALALALALELELVRVRVLVLVLVLVLVHKTPLAWQTLRVRWRRLSTPRSR